MISNTFVKLGVAILLLICLLDMPYGYFQFVRFLSSISFCFLAFQANEKNKNIDTVIFLILILLFQPFFKVSLGRFIWNIIDIFVATFLIIHTFISKNKNQHVKKN